MSHRLHRHIIGRYPTPPPVRARRPPWLLSTGLVIKLERVARGLSYCSGPLRASRAVQEKQHVARRAPLTPSPPQDATPLGLIQRSITNWKPGPRAVAV